MIFLVNSCRTLTRLKYSTLRRTEGVPLRRAINVRRFTYFVVHPRAHSPIFHHFKTQFASARSTILLQRRIRPFLPFFFYLFLLRAPPSVPTLTTPDNRSLSFRVHRVFAFIDYDEPSLFRLGAISGVITRYAELAINLYRD